MKDELATTHTSTDNIKRDYCDGSFYKNHPLFSKDKAALQIIVYYDDIEVANPLGSRAGNHKLGTCNYNILNVYIKCTHVFIPSSPSLSLTHTHTHTHYTHTMYTCTVHVHVLYQIIGIGYTMYS